MKRFLFMAAALAAAAPASKADDAPVRAWVAHEERIKSLEDRVAALETQPPKPQPAPAAALPPSAPRLNASGVPTYPAPAGFRWFKDGTLDGPAPWLLTPDATAIAVPSFATPVRSGVYQMFTPRPSCPGGQCPR